MIIASMTIVTVVVFVAINVIIVTTVVIVMFVTLLLLAFSVRFSDYCCYAWYHPYAHHITMILLPVTLIVVITAFVRILGTGVVILFLVITFVVPAWFL